MREISIIVPVYNVEKYVKQCLDSLLSQTFEDYEIIIVDDGSTDNSYLICRQYEFDNKVKLFHRENHGISQTRAFGVAQAHGKWILFVDSDDYVDERYCELLYQAATEEHADIAECNYSFFNEKGILNAHVLSRCSVVYEKDDFIDNVVRKTIVDGSEAVVLWNKIYRRETIMTYVRDYGESLLEDYLFNMQYYQGVKKYCFIDEVLIHYRKSVGSLTKKSNPETYAILKRVQEKKETILESMNISMPEDKRASARWFVNYAYQFLLKVALSCMDRKQAKKYIFEICSDMVMVDLCDSISSENKFARNVAIGNLNCEYQKIIHKADHIRWKRNIKMVIKKAWGKDNGKQN